MSKYPLINRKPIKDTFSLNCVRNIAGKCYFGIIMPIATDHYETLSEGFRQELS